MTTLKNMVLAIIAFFLSAAAFHAWLNETMPRDRVLADARRQDAPVHDAQRRTRQALDTHEPSSPAQAHASSARPAGDANALQSLLPALPVDKILGQLSGRDEPVPGGPDLTQVSKLLSSLSAEQARSLMEQLKASAPAGVAPKPANPQKQ